MRYRDLIPLTLLALCGLAGSLHAQAATQPHEGKIIAGTKIAPPWAYKDSRGNWTGLCIELWNSVSMELGVETEYREYDNISDLLSAVENGEIKIAASAVTMTANRDQVMDFTHTYAPANLGIAVLPVHKSGWWDAIKRIFSWDFGKALLSLLILLLIAGFLLWLVERRRNATQFGGTPTKGIGSAFWWSAVTMTTVGYGDKAPITGWGRTIGLLWMFASVIVISGFTGAIASSLTIGQLKPTIKNQSDLPYVKVGALAGSTSAIWLKEHLIPYTPFQTTQEGLEGLLHQKIEAFVNDDLVLRYEVRNRFPGRILVLTDTFDPSFYAYAVKLNDKDLKRINILLLQELSKPEWESLWRQYIGP